MNPARTLGPDIVGNDYTGWWIYILGPVIGGPVIGAVIAVAIIGAVRGLPGKQEREAAQGGALPMQDTHPDRTTAVSRHHERTLLRRSKRAVLREQEEGLPVLAICIADAETPAMSSSRPSTIRTGGGPRWP